MEDVVDVVVEVADGEVGGVEVADAETVELGVAVGVGAATVTDSLKTVAPSAVTVMRLVPNGTLHRDVLRLARVHVHFDRPLPRGAGRDCERNGFCRQRRTRSA